MNENKYRRKVIVECSGVTCGNYCYEVEVGDPEDEKLWSCPLVRAFLDDDNIQRITITSITLGVSKTIRKQFA